MITEAACAFWITTKRGSFFGSPFLSSPSEDGYIWNAVQRIRSHVIIKPSRRSSMKRAVMLAVFVSFSLIVVSAGIAQQKAGETVVCPVSGETMLKSQAKVSYDYEGKTYYFCHENCKEKFVKEPAKYIEKNADMQEIYT